MNAQLFSSLGALLLLIGFFTVGYNITGYSVVSEYLAPPSTSSSTTSSSSSSSDGGGGGGGGGGSIAQTTQTTPDETDREVAPSETPQQDTSTRSSSFPLTADLDKEVAEIRQEPLISIKRAQFALKTIFQVGYILALLLVFVEIALKMKHWLHHPEDVERWIISQHIRGTPQDEVERQLIKNAAPLETVKLVDKIYRTHRVMKRDVDRSLLLSGIVMLIFTLFGLSVSTILPEHKDALPMHVGAAAIGLGIVLMLLSRTGPELMRASRRP